MSAEIVEDKGAAAPAAPNKKKKLIIIGAAAAAALSLGGGGAAFFLSGSKSDKAAEADAGHGEAAAEADAGGEGGHGGGEGEAGAKYVDVPAMVVNLRSPDGGARFLKLHFMLVPGPKGNEANLKDALPLILDSYQPFLRELRPEDLAGSAAVFRVKEELLIRAVRAAGPGMVKDVLIQDLVQQ